MEVIRGHVVARGIAQRLQNLDALHNLAHGEGAQPVKVDDTLLRLLRALIALGPFLNVAIQSHGGNVSSRHQIHRVAIGNQIRERQAARIGVVHQFAEAHAERTNRGRHQHIRARGRLGAALQGAIVQRTHLIGVVREVGVRASVIERELSADEQRALMVRSRERSAEGGAGLTVGHKRVGKEQTGLGREAIGYLTSLAHEAVLHLHRVVDRATVADNRVLANHTRANEHRRVLTTQNRTLVQSGSATNLAVALDYRVRNILRIDNLHTVTHDAALRRRHPHLVVNQLFQSVHQCLVRVVLHHEGSQLRVQFPEQRHVAVAHLVEY